MSFCPNSGASVVRKGDGGQQSRVKPVTGCPFTAVCDSRRRLWETEVTGDGVRCSQHVGLIIHSSRGQEVSVVISDGCVLGSHNLGDWHIQTLILMFSFHTR